MEAGERSSANAGLAAAAESSTIGPSVNKLSEILDKMSKMQAPMKIQKQEISRLSKALNAAGSGASASTAETKAQAMTTDYGNGKRNFADITCYNCHV
jgi:hypothetical protein